jgi:hypothetical protein
VPSSRERFIFYSKFASVRVSTALTCKKSKNRTDYFVEFDQYASGLTVFNLEKL